MSANDNKNKDFIDKIFDFFEFYQKSGVRFLAVVICFILLFLAGAFLAPQLIRFMVKVLPFNIELLQISMLDVFYNYLKLAICFALALTFPVFLYQFGKLKADEVTFDFKMNLLIASLTYTLVLFGSVFVVFKFLLPLLVYFLYAVNFNITSFTMSLTSLVSEFLILTLLTILFVLLPFLRIIIKKSLFFNYATLVRFKKPVMIYAGIFTALLALPVEIIAIGIIFVIFTLWYRVLVHFSKTRD